MSTPLSTAAGISRRRFIRSASAGAAAAAAFPAVLRAARPNGKVHLAVVGVSARGYGDLHSTASHPNVHYVGFCDVDTKAFAKADADKSQKISKVEMTTFLRG